MRRTAHVVNVFVGRPLVPAASRMTVKTRAVAALRRTRHAIEEIEVQLDDILDHLHGKKPLAQGAPDRLRASANEARAAMASLTDFSDIYG
jgi:hypothetical protein